MQPVDDYNEIKIHSNLDSYLDDVKELEVEWLKEILLEFNIDISEYSNAELTYVLRSSDISITSYPSFGGVLVKYKGKIVAEWGGPELKIKKDEKGLFYEITIRHKIYELGEDDV